jgi:hypothetical protein
VSRACGFAVGRCYVSKGVQDRDASTPLCLFSPRDAGRCGDDMRVLQVLVRRYFCVMLIRQAARCCA